jgi:hypothetical protein
MSRYRVGCAGQFMLGMDSGYDDKNTAIAACEYGPPGCEVYDSLAKRWIGPTCYEDIDEAKARLVAGQEDRRA